MRVIITGDRSWICPELAKVIVNRLVARYGLDLVIVHGAASGVDQSFARTLGGCRTTPMRGRDAIR